ncbi:MFS transporter, CP family, cyanate transporter [Nocardioides alpinus]|uniref:MFS transporter n=1 Tax=Nocardioides alpinus TaxID=748909 RepID=A0A1I0VE66_9ACTN|nr:MFS transporter [Nocardioides alpinus]PKH38005.1 MFS transporter [Nocardioides alpinus]SFA74644.1 MFS transporter, CP family, cyanate transporter [Nocardioides alpinus]
MSEADDRSRSRVVPFGLLLAAVVLVSINLRPGASSLGPVLEEVREGLGMSAGVAGVMTGLPGLCFGLVGALAVGFARRVGMTAGIAIGLAVGAAGLLLRVTTDSVPTFLVFTVVGLAGMAIGNVLVPAWIKAHGHAVALMTVYGTGLVVGGTIGSLATAPVTEGTGSWRAGLGMWGVLLLVSVPLWAWLALREHRSPSEHAVSGAAPSGRIVHSPTAIALTVLFGVQSMHAYVQFGWLPQIYRDAGISASSAGALQGLLSSVGIIGALAMPTVIERGRGLRPLMVSFGVMLALGYTGLLVAPATAPWLWALMLGFSGLAFPTAMALITARTRHPSVTAQLSGFVQPVGYALAATGPFVVGLIHEATGSWSLVIVLLALTAVPLTLAGLRVANPTYVDDEI